MFSSFSIPFHCVDCSYIACYGLFFLVASYVVYLYVKEIYYAESIFGAISIIELNIECIIWLPIDEFFK